MTIEQLAEQLTSMSNARLMLLAEAMVKLQPERTDFLQSAIGSAFFENELELLND